MKPTLDMNAIIAIDLAFLNALTQSGFFGKLSESDTNDLDFVREVWVDEMSNRGFPLDSKFEAVANAELLALFIVASDECIAIARHAAHAAREAL
jgi:hypothetical protein